MENKNIDLTKILKDCPKGTKLYSTIFGDVELVSVYKNKVFPIEVKRSDNTPTNFAKDGKLYIGYSGECALFPSKDQRDWSKFKPKKTKQPKFNPKTFQPFDKVLARNDREDWSCMFFSHIVKDEETYPYACGYDWFTYCIPYNDDTKHLIGKAEEAPEYYRYWED